jgi:hypothetical protein
MLFLHPWLLIGLAGVALPILIHLVRRQAAKPIDWGAMRFLFDTISVRRRKMEWEDLVLMAARCLLLALLALAVARPFLTPDSQVPWLLVLPAGLLAIASFGASFVLSSAGWRWGLRLMALLLLMGAGALGYWEKEWNLRRFEASGRRDVALVIDASASMEFTQSGQSVFQRAIDEAKQLVNEAPRGTAFLVVLGGPSPEAKTATPLTHRADVLGVLDSLRPLGGTFRAHEALGVATLGLAQGSNTSKEIIVFTDAQRSGWRLDDPSAWKTLQQSWQGLPTPPKLLVRSFGEPGNLVNVALTSCTASRAVVGTDRDVAVRVEVMNTGVNAITPGPVSLEIDQKKIAQSPVGMLLPGQRQMVEFRHHFSQAGAHVVRASIEAQDDLPVDNRREMVQWVQERLPVLLVDGNPSGSFFDRAAGYTALALAPSTSIISGQSGEAKFLMDPRVVSAAQLKLEDLDEARVVVLADVPRLPEKLASALAAKVVSGTGLIVIAGPRTEPDFYNGWQSLDGAVLPLTLAEEATDDKGISPAPSTFVHESLSLFAKRSDLADAVIKRWRKTRAATDHGVQAAAFSNGEAFLATKSLGGGRVLLGTCAFDARAGNLPARQAFVPFVHEWIAWCAGTGTQWNVDSLWSPSVALPQTGGGLTGYYARSKYRDTEELLQRVDATIDFDWSQAPPAKGLPRDQFKVTWKAALLPPVTGEYVFEAEVNDKLVMTWDDGTNWSWEENQKPDARRHLTAGEGQSLEIFYQQEWGAAFARLYWTPPGGKRQIIPSSAWIPTLPVTDPMRVIDPQGLPREAVLSAGRRGQELQINGPAVPGIYQVAADQRLAEMVAVKPATLLPVAVKRDAGESIFTPMNDEDLALIRAHGDLLLPQSLDDVLSVLQGKGFGREIARWLAIGAVAFFLLESLLARWVARSRRTGEDVRVEFGEDTVWKGGLR